MKAKLNDSGRRQDKAALDSTAAAFFSFQIAEEHSAFFTQGQWLFIEIGRLGFIH